MRSQIIFIVSCVAAFSVSAAAQVRTVNNASLEMYKQERLKNEREYRENYARLGMPSPEEIDRRKDESAKRMAELSDKLRAEELERERIAAEILISSRRAYSNDGAAFLDGALDDSIYSSGRFHRMRRRLPFSQPGYFAGGQFWPTGGATRAQPIRSTRK